MNFSSNVNSGHSGGVAVSTPAMASTFSLLMKIVRDLALNRDDPEGREHHKHFVEQQFRNSDARMHRVINECSGDLTTLIQLFDLIIRRVDRSRREVSASLFSIRNCKQLLLLRRSECRRLWFQSNEQKALVELYDRLIEIRAVRQRCQDYVSLGYLVHAACLVQRAMDVVTVVGKKLRKQSKTSDSEEYLSLKTQADGKFLEPHGKWTSNQAKPILPHSKEFNEDCLHQLRSELVELGEDLLSSLQLAIEMCLFESHEVGSQRVARQAGSGEGWGAETWSSRLVAFWKEKQSDNRLLSFDSSNKQLPSRQHGGGNQLSGVDSQSGMQGVKSGLISSLPEPLSFEVDRISLANTPSLHSISGSTESCLQLVMEAAEKLTYIPDAVARLLQHLEDVFPRRLDSIAVEESAAVMFSLTNEPSGDFSDRNDSTSDAVTTDNSTQRRRQCRGLSTLLSNMFNKYDKIVGSCKPLYWTALSERHAESQSAGISTSRSLLNEESPFPTNYYSTMSRLWAMVQKPLAAVLLTHLIKDLPSEVQKMNFSLRDFGVDDVGGICFNSELVLDIAFRHHRIKSADTLNPYGPSKLFINEDPPQTSSDSAMDDMSIDLDRFFFDPNAITSAYAGGSPSQNQSPLHKMPTLHEVTQHKKPHYDSSGVRVKNAHTRLFRFDKSAQVQSLSEYYQDVGHNLKSAVAPQDRADMQIEQTHSMDMNAAIIGLRSVTVCTPSYRNIHDVYPKLNQICELLDTRIQGDCFSSTNDDAENSNIMHRIHLTLFKDTVLEFVKYIFVVQLRNDVRRKISEGLPALLRSTELLPTPFKRPGADESFDTKHDGPPVPILFYTYLSMQAIDELLAALFDIPVHCSELWIAINEIVLQHRAGSTNLFTSTLVATPLSVEWVRDVDVNRHLRSMPTLKQLLLSSNRHQGSPGSVAKTMLTSAQTLSFDSGSSRRKSLLLTVGTPTGSHSIKETETILLNLTNEELNSSERMITDYRHTRLIAHQHESMMWFVSEFRKTVRRRRMMMTTGGGVSSKPENESVVSSIYQTEHLAEDILLVLFVEIRVHCFYHLRLLSNPNNLLQYAARPSNSSGNIGPICSHSASLSNLASSSYWLSNLDCRSEELQSVYVCEDSSIQSLVRDLFRLQESLIGALSLNKIDFLFDGLGYLIATVFIELVGKLSLLDDIGLLKMRRNILSVHNCLLGLLNQRRQRHSNLSAMDDTFSLVDDAMKSQDSDRDYSFVDRAKKLHQFSTESDSQDLLRALHFYDLLTCSSAESLIERIQQEHKRGNFKQQDYSALVSLKYRMDQASSCAGTGSPPKQHVINSGDGTQASTADNKPADLQSLLNRLASVFDRQSSGEKSGPKNTPNSVNSSV